MIHCKHSRRVRHKSVAAAGPADLAKLARMCFPSARPKQDTAVMACVDDFVAEVPPIVLYASKLFHRL